jgi:hypothetical protein
MKRMIFSTLLIFLTIVAPSLSFAQKTIKGLMPVDVYLNMEKQGFTTVKLFTDEGSSWTNKKSDAGIDYEVSTYTSSGASSVENVRATAWIDVSQKKISATLPFFIFASSLPYDGSNSQQAEKWIQNNFNKKKATTVIGGVKFTISAPSIMMRIMLIEPIN